MSRVRGVEEKVYGWKARIAVWIAGFLLFETLTGLSIWLLPFSVPNQVFVILHTLVGVLFLIPAVWYTVKHWFWYRQSVMTHLKLLGYLSGFAIAVCGFSGLILTVQALFYTRISYFWDDVHIVSTLAMLVFTIPHLVLIVTRAWNSPGMRPVVTAARDYSVGMVMIAVIGLLVGALGFYAYDPIRMVNDFPDDYSYKYGEDRPFAPSQATTSTGSALDPRVLSGSESCGTSGCHEQIYDEWRISSHRWSAMDIAFQKIQLTMAEQNGPESTRYCGGCHDPISLFSGSKNIFTDSSQLTNLVGYQEGVSCLTCHGVQKTDLKGNAEYEVSAPGRYMFELEYDEGKSGFSRSVRDFLIRAYPRYHVDTLSKRLFKTPEYCAACHKQYIDEEINSVGWVQLQNQYDNWRKSRWNQPGHSQQTIECRECHMPLVESSDPASGDSSDYNRSPDDGKHRSHRFIAANQLMPQLLKLPGWEEQVRLTERWLKGEFEIPEIADKWASGPAVSLEVTGPDEIRSGQQVDLKTIITSNKVGHDFPTGPLDIIQAWVELVVTDDQGREVYATGRVDEKGFIEPGSFIFKAEPVDQYGNLIDRHNLWEMVGVRHRRALFPGFSDTATFSFYCPSLHLTPDTKPTFEPEKSYNLTTPGGTTSLQVTARLKYRKIDQYLLTFVFGEDVGLTSPVTDMASAQKTIRVVSDPERPVGRPGR